MKKDKYDRAIKYLTKHPQDISAAWGLPDARHRPEVNAAHCLFYVARPDPEAGCDHACGCLTQIRHYPHYGVRGKSGRIRAALTERIRQDKRIPEYPHEITVELLPVFAEWQRRLDKELGR